jgi:hypothetical protein
MSADQELRRALLDAGATVDPDTDRDLARVVREARRRDRRRRVAVLAGSAVAFVLVVSLGVVRLHAGPPAHPAARHGGVPSAAPTTAHAGPLPDELLRPSDLGSRGRWTDRPVDRQGASARTVALPRCAGTPATVVTGSSESQLYRGVGSAGDGEWVLDETVVTLQAPAASLARSVLGEVTCPAAVARFGTMLVLEHAPGELVLGQRLPDGSIGFATALAIVGDTLIQLDTFPGGTTGGVALPGGPRWFAGVAQRAMTRAAG